MRDFLKIGAVTLVAALQTSAAFAQDAQTVVATVNGTDITLGHVIVLHQQLPQEYKGLPDEVLFEGIISQLIEQTLLADAAKNGEEPIPAEVIISVQNEERALVASVHIDRVIARDISDEAIQAAYDEAYGDVAAEPEFNASHILVETEEEAQALVVELEAGAIFAELAMEKSTGPSGPNGGELGWFGLGMMVEPFETAVIAMEVGQISAPVETQFGWHVLILNETRDKPAPTLEETRPQLMDQLRQQAVETEIAALRDSADIADLAEGLDPTLMRDTSLLSK